jgi:hypothetical protein
MSTYELLPIPVPTKPGAIVRTVDGVWIKADPSQFGCWTSVEGFEGWKNLDEIGRITEVLSEGVDL